MSWQPGQTIADLEKDAIEKSLRFYQGNKPKVAEALGISLRTLYNKLAIYEDIQNGIYTESGVRVESTEKVSKESTVSLPVGQEV